MNCTNKKLRERVPYFVFFEKDGTTSLCTASHCSECGTYYMSNEQMSFYRKKVMESRIKNVKNPSSS
jgi:hypothetical protein